MKIALKIVMDIENGNKSFKIFNFFPLIIQLDIDIKIIRLNALKMIK
jgi:hypothetical protein